MPRAVRGAAVRATSAADAARSTATFGNTSGGAPGARRGTRTRKGTVTRSCKHHNKVQDVFLLMCQNCGAKRGAKEVLQPVRVRRGHEGVLSETSVE